MPRTFVLYHAHCPDGFGAAFAAWLKFKDEAVYLPCRYGDPPPELPECAEVSILDFSFKRDVLMALDERVQALSVVDHHRTAQEDLDGLAYARFDMSKSGAVLAWESFHPGMPVPSLLLYVQDRDLWQWKLPNSHEVSAAISSYPHDFEVWRRMLLNEIDLVAEGTTIRRLQLQKIEGNVHAAFLTEVGGHVVPVVNTNNEISETGNELCKRYPQYPFSAAYFDHPTGQRKWSLRSIGDFDVSEIAKTYRGGGHKNAAGFEIADPFSVPNLGSLENAVRTAGVLF